jgi:hypothetical protein
MSVMRIAPHHDSGAWPRADSSGATRRSRARPVRPTSQAPGAVSRASFGYAIAFSWTVVYTTTRSRSLVSIAFVRRTTERLSCSSASICSSQPLAQPRAIKRCRVLEHHSPPEVLEILVLHPAVTECFVREIVHVLEDQQPGHQPRRQRRLSRPDATNRAETSGQELPVNLRLQTHQRMAKVDDLLQRRAKQIAPTIVARLAHGFSASFPTGLGCRKRPADAPMMPKKNRVLGRAV